METERLREFQRNIAGFVVAGGVIAFGIGMILFAVAFSVQAIWRGLVIPADVQAAVDDGLRRGSALIILGLGMVFIGWWWHRGLRWPGAE